MNKKELKKYIIYSIILFILSLLYFISIIDNCILLIIGILLLVIFESIEDKNSNILIFDLIWLIIISILYFFNI